MLACTRVLPGAECQCALQGKRELGIDVLLGDLEQRDIGPGIGPGRAQCERLPVIPERAFEVRAGFGRRRVTTRRS